MEKELCQPFSSFSLKRQRHKPPNDETEWKKGQNNEPLKRFS
jgi:hypothetical protein